jgi:hypothetical protein
MSSREAAAQEHCMGRAPPRPAAGRGFLPRPPPPARGACFPRPSRGAGRAAAAARPSPPAPHKQGPALCILSALLSGHPCPFPPKTAAGGAGRRARGRGARGRRARNVSAPRPPRRRAARGHSCTTHHSRSHASRRPRPPRPRAALPRPFAAGPIIGGPPAPLWVLAGRRTVNCFVSIRCGVVCFWLGVGVGWQGAVEGWVGEHHRQGREREAAWEVTGSLAASLGCLELRAGGLEVPNPWPADARARRDPL